MPASELVADRYQLVKIIGRGGMADVYEGHDARLDRRVAIKVVHANLASNPTLRRRFDEEARISARLSDPHIVAIYDTGDEADQLFIVMELLSGRTLADEIHSGPLPEARARELVMQVLCALRAAHSAGIVHRDVKPANVLFQDLDTVKVADFGIATAVESGDRTVTSAILGTPCYLAPERVAGEPATVATDLYGAGVVLYEMLAGRRPYEEAGAMALCHAIATRDPIALQVRRPDVSAAMGQVVARAMARNPLDRYSSASEMLAALDPAAVTVRSSPPAPPRLAEDAFTEPVGPVDPTRALTPAAAPRPLVVDKRRDLRPPPDALPAPARRRAGLWLAVAAVVFVVLAIGVVYWSGHSSSNAVPPGAPTTSMSTPAALTQALDHLQQAIRP